VPHTKGILAFQVPSRKILTDLLLRTAVFGYNCRRGWAAILSAVNFADLDKELVENG